MSEFNKIKEMYDSFKSDFQTKLKEAFMNDLQEFFKEYPEVETITFPAYTPYFNDGEECVYKANVYAAEINGYDEYDGPKTGKVDKKMYEIVIEMISEVDDDIWEDMVGDHVKVTLSREGVSTEEYSDHD